MSPTLDGICTVPQNVPSGLTVSIGHGTCVYVNIISQGLRFAVFRNVTVNFKYTFKITFQNLEVLMYRTHPLVTDE